MKVCFFGSYVKDSYGIPSGNGGTLLKMILEKAGIEIVECHESIENFSSLIPAYFKLFFKHRKLDYDIMMIPWRGILTLPLAKFIHKKPIVYFPAFSIYDTLVNDRKKIGKKSLKARFAHFVDKLACKWVDKVVLESTEEINYFVKEFNLPKGKFRQLPLAADESIFVPLPFKEPKKEFVVLFFGSFIPVHGIETIVKSAENLRNQNDISFKICGDGQTKPMIEELIKKNNLKNVQLLGLVDKETLLENIQKSDVCLGIFGNTCKAKKVVTNKVFQVLASKKPLITMESPTATEAHLKNEINCLLIPSANPEKLAEAILLLKNNPDKCRQVAEAGYQTYMEYLSMEQVGRGLVGIIKELL